MTKCVTFDMRERNVQSDDDKQRGWKEAKAQSGLPGSSNKELDSECHSLAKANNSVTNSQCSCATSQLLSLLRETRKMFVHSTTIVAHLGPQSIARLMQTRRPTRSSDSSLWRRSLRSNNRELTPNQPGDLWPCADAAIKHIEGQHDH